LRGIYSPILKFDEFELFRSFIRQIPGHPLWPQISDGIDNKTQTGINNVRNFKRIQIIENNQSNNDNVEMKARKLLKAKKVQKFNVNFDANNQNETDNGLNNNNNTN